MPSQPDLVISAHDARRLEALIASRAADGGDVVQALEAELLRADVRDPGDIPPDVVTMNSIVRCTDASDGSVRELHLVYPDQADAARGRVSVLAPVGAALLGLRTGAGIDWPLPGGRTARLRVDAVLRQPEAEGRLD